MTQKDLFAMLGAPLANPRWSWGSVRSDGSVFLRVWQDEIQKLENVLFVRITDQKRFKDDLENPGYRERLKHIDLIKQGASSFMVMCEAVDVKAVPRTVKDFNQEKVFPGGIIKEFNGDWWIELSPGVPVRQVMPLPKGNEA